MNPNLLRLRAWLWWLVPFAALALLLGIETDWGRSMQRLPGPVPAIEAKPVTTALLPEYRIDGGLGAHEETVSRTLFNPTRRPAPAQTGDNARSSMPKGKYVLTGTAVAGDRHIAFLKEVSGGKSRVVRQGDQINGVLVATVAADRVRFTQGDDAEELVLKVAAGPKTTLPPAPPPAAAPAAGSAPLPGAVPPATPAAGQPTAGAANAAGAAQRQRRVRPMGTPNAQATGTAQEAAGAAPAGEPAPTPAPAATPAAATGSGNPASSNPGWNDVFERMRQRGGAK